MCGICGEIRWDGHLANVENMLPHLERRGPNGKGIWQDNHVALGHQRLAVIDPLTQSNQPFVDDELILVFNGTLYNYPALKKELQGLAYPFRTEGDTEALLKAYQAWQENCVYRFDGMFAFAIWDKRQQSLFLARDRTGIKPLYYAFDGQAFRFASTTQALLASGIDKTINPIGLHHFFMLHGAVPAPYTILKHIAKLPPASWMRIDAKGQQMGPHVYWQIAKRPADEIFDFNAFKSTLDAAIIREYEVSDVPVGVLLSGGLDSSYMVAVLHEHGVKEIPTFTIGFESHPLESGDEFQYSNWVAQQFQTRHQRFMVPNHLFLERLQEVVQSMSEPLQSQDAIGFYLLAEMVRNAGLKVVLSGQGADELLGGYRFYANMQSARGSALERVKSHYFEFSKESLSQLLNPLWTPLEDVTSKWIAPALLDDDDFMYSFLRQDISQLIVDDPVRRVDNMTMSWGVEARVPFLCHHVIEQGMRIPTNIKMLSNGKWPLKKLSEAYFPQQFIHRPKGYFPVPILKFIEDPLYTMIRDVLNSQSCMERGIFQRSAIQQLLDLSNANLTPLGFNPLWLLGSLEMWFQRL